MIQLLPWQEKHWQNLTARISKDKMPHAWLFTGRRGIGKANYAKYFAKWLMCSNLNNNNACNQCQSCSLFTQDMHPDLFKLPEEDGISVGIDDIRNLTQEFLKPSHSGMPKVALISDVDGFSSVVANALLKTLEEPQTKVFFLLTATSKQNIAPTIVSRSFCINLPEPKTDDAQLFISNLNSKIPQKSLSHLNLLQTCPIAAQLWIENGFWDNYAVLLKPFFANNVDDIKNGAKIFSDHPKESLYLLYNWFVFGFKNYRQVGTENILPLFKPLASFVKKFGLSKLWLFVDVLGMAIKSYDRTPGITKQLLYESIVYRWSLGDVDV
jgi:DNA polymerase III delta' subunit